MMEFSVPTGCGLTLAPIHTPVLQICAAGETILTIERDGTVTGAVEQASEAGRVFVESIRQHLPNRFPQAPMDTGAERLNAIAKEAAVEAFGASQKWPSFNSAHEAYAVLAEEVDELWDEVKVNQTRRDLAKMRAECIQVAAMALRFAADICTEEAIRK